MLGEFFGVKKPVAATEDETRKSLAEVADLFGPAMPLPPEMKRMIEMAEEMKRTHKGLIGNA